MNVSLLLIQEHIYLLVWYCTSCNIASQYVCYIENKFIGINLNSIAGQ